ncbi:hypothetical protein K438DRAFT_1766759 [Mycena galopus ATCC 62051]|nr:hypothetical protein K438DRAFT_1766759 [Mycena galopus ATCC 62051]
MAVEQNAPAEIPTRHEDRRDFAVGQIDLISPWYSRLVFIAQNTLVHIDESPRTPRSLSTVYAAANWYRSPLVCGNEISLEIHMSWAGCCPLKALSEVVGMRQERIHNALSSLWAVAMVVVICSALASSDTSTNSANKGRKKAQTGLEDILNTRLEANRAALEFSCKQDQDRHKEQMTVLHAVADSLRGLREEQERTNQMLCQQELNRREQEIRRHEK